MSGQTAVNAAGQPQAVAGQVSQAMEGMDIVSRFNAETVTCLAFGTGVKNGTNDHECKILTANSETVQGVVKWGNNHTPGATGDVDQTATPPGLKPAAGFGLVRKGRVWVAVDAGVTSIAANVDRAYCRCASNGGNTKVGYFSNASDSSYSIDIRKAAVFVSGLRYSADGLKMAELEVDFTNQV